MPELLLHFAIPFSISAPIIGVKRAIVVGIVGMLPDVDALLHVHRSMTHSIIILTILSLIPLYITSFKLKGEITCTTLTPLPNNTSNNGHVPNLHPNNLSNIKLLHTSKRKGECFNFTINNPIHTIPNNIHTNKLPKLFTDGCTNIHKRRIHNLTPTSSGSNTLKPPQETFQNHIIYCKVNTSRGPQI
jgi:hypothetical protein